MSDLAHPRALQVQQKSRLRAGFWLGGRPSGGPSGPNGLPGAVAAEGREPGHLGTGTQARSRGGGQARLHRLEPPGDLEEPVAPGHAPSGCDTYVHDFQTTDPEEKFPRHFKQRI